MMLQHFVLHFCICQSVLMLCKQQKENGCFLISLNHGKWGRVSSAGPQVALF